ncbi:MAG TPA: menaquinone biosynthesis protein [Candidatus Polarisedimenticolia bacterium]|jgi:chorismate dehydratase
MLRTRLASVSYLNALPLTWGLTHGARRPGFEILLTPPADCARLLSDGLVDVALIPSVEFGRIPGLIWVPSTGVSSREEVRSVLLLTRVPPERIETVALDVNSRTSVALVRLVLAHRYSCHPRMEPMAPDPDAMLANHDAALLIGDHALAASVEYARGASDYPGRPGTRVLDLAREWHEMTRMPFVFALWACRPVVDAAEMSALLDWSLEEGLAHIDDIASSEGSRTGLPAPVISSYLRHNIRYRLGPAEADSLRLFYRMCRDEGILPGTGAKAAAGSVRASGAADRPAIRRPGRADRNDSR